jgi:monoterpene epsilon-lactone hydrolase
MSWQNAVLSLLLRVTMKRFSSAQIDVAAARSRARRGAARKRVPAGWRITGVPVATSSMPVPGEWIEPEPGAPDATITMLYLHGGGYHGGGYFCCSPATHRPITGALARDTDARVFVPDYRLAPEHPYPAALEDALAAFQALLGQGIAPEKLVLAGDSAGGGLALATLVALRDAGAALSAGAILFSPWTDLAVTGASVSRNAGADVMFHGDAARRAAALYLGDTSPTDPLASPRYAELHGLPPLCIQASDSEVLFSDAADVAARAMAAGVQAQFTTWRGLPHVWQIFTPFLPEAVAALEEAARFARKVTRSMAGEEPGH